MNEQERREIRELSAHGNAANAVRPPTIKRDGRFYAGMATLVLSEIIMPLSALVVPLLGLPTAQATILFGVLLEGIPNVLFIVAVGLLGKETIQYFIHMTKSALRAVVDRRFRGAMYVIFDKCFLIFSVAERLLDRLHLLVEALFHFRRAALS